MYEIKCPKCGEVFQVEKAAYAEIVDQVRNEQFNAELSARLKSERETMAARQAAALADAEKRFGEQAARKDQEIFRPQEQAASSPAKSSSSPHSQAHPLTRAGTPSISA